MVCVVRCQSPGESGQSAEIKIRAQQVVLAASLAAEWLQSAIRTESIAIGPPRGGRTHQSPIRDKSADGHGARHAPLHHHVLLDRKGSNVVSQFLLDHNPRLADDYVLAI